MRKQTGIWVDAAVWQAYRELCSREKLRPAGQPLIDTSKIIRIFSKKTDEITRILKSFEKTPLITEVSM